MSIIDFKLLKISSSIDGWIASDALTNQIHWKISISDEISKWDKKRSRPPLLTCLLDNSHIMVIPNGKVYLRWSRIPWSQMHEIDLNNGYCRMLSQEETSEMIWMTMQSLLLSIGSRTHLTDYEWSNINMYLEILESYGAPPEIIYRNIKDSMSVIVYNKSERKYHKWNFANDCPNFKFSFPNLNRGFDYCNKPTEDTSQFILSTETITMKWLSLPFLNVYVTETNWKYNGFPVTQLNEYEHLIRNPSFNHDNINHRSDLPTVYCLHPDMMNLKNIIPSSREVISIHFPNVISMTILSILYGFQY